MGRDAGAPRRPDPRRGQVRHEYPRLRQTSPRAAALPQPLPSVIRTANVRPKGQEPARFRRYCR
jgi:hypothetical protein